MEILCRPSSGLLRAFPLLISLLICASSVHAANTERLLVKSLTVSGRARTYYVYEPVQKRSFEGQSLLLAFHGGGGTAPGFEKITSLSELAEKNGFLLVYPQGLENRWNDGRPNGKSKADDLLFIDTLISELHRAFKIDLRRIYATGLSNGGLFSFRLACDRSEKIAAIATVGANLGEVLAKHCTPSRPIPVLHIVSDEDPLMPFKGGNITGPFGRKTYGSVLSAAETFDFWSLKNHCTQRESGKLEARMMKDDATEIAWNHAAACQGDAEIKQFVVIGGGHTWPSGWQYFKPFLIGKTTQKLDANKEIWQFFEAH